MKTRIISGIVMVPLLLIIYFGGIPLLAAAALIAYVGVTEFYNGFENVGVHPSKPIAYVMITILYAGHLFLGVNHTFLKHLDEFTRLEYPILLGTSRKSVIGLTLDLPKDQREEGTLVTTVLAAQAHCGFVRVHDVEKNVRAIKMMEAINGVR